MSDKPKFSPGDKLRWLGISDGRQTALRLNEPAIVMNDSQHEVCVRQNAVASWRPKSEFEPWDKPESPDAAAELAKIAKLLDDCGFDPNPGGSTFTRFKTVLIQVAKLQSEQWGKAAVNLEAIK